jgi:hypothetical protein
VNFAICEISLEIRQPIVAGHAPRLNIAEFGSNLQQRSGPRVMTITGLRAIS